MKTLRILPFLIGLALVACTPPPASHSLDDEISRIEHGMMPTMVMKGETRKMTLASRMRFYHVPAVSIAFFNQSGILWGRAYGAKTDTLFQAGSISKSVSAVGIMKLVQQRRLNLDQNVNEGLRTWKVPQNALTAKQPVTLRELLSHTAGTSVHGFEGYERGKPLPTLVQVLDGKPPANSPPIRVELPPGKQFQYSGGGYVIALQLVLDTIHEPFAGYMQRAVLAPLGMTNSTFEQPLPQALWSRAAVAYDANGKPYPGEWHVYREQTAAGLWTTPSDLAKFAIGMGRALHGEPGGVISAATATEMLTPIKEHYGLGFDVEGSGSTARFGHNGANAGFQALLVMHSNGKGQGAAIMTDSDNGSALISEIVDSVAAVYRWRETEFHPTQRMFYPLSSRALETFTGTYKSGQMLFIIARHGDTLSAKIPDGPSFLLYPEGPKKFFLLDLGADVTFATNTAGAVDGFTILQQPGLKARKISPN